MTAFARQMLSDSLIVAGLVAGTVLVPVMGIMHGRIGIVAATLTALAFMTAGGAVKL